MFEEVIYNLLLGLDLIVHVLKLLLKPIQSPVGFIFGVLAESTAALACLAVPLAAALADLDDVDLCLGLQQQLLPLTELRLHHEQSLRLAQPELELFLLPLPPRLKLVVLGPGDTGHVQRGDLHRGLVSRQVLMLFTLSALFLL